MISELRIRGFKCFQDRTLPFAPLTVLTGLNGGGKSTVVQAVLLARQSATSPSGTVQLNGPDRLFLGESEDVVNVDAPSSTITVDLLCDGSRYRYAFEAPVERSMYLSVTERPDRGPSALSGTGRGFMYLCAERLGPREQQEVVSGAPDTVDIGPQGEHVAQLLTLHDRRVVRSEVRHPGPDSTVHTLLTQVEYWMADIVRTVLITAEWPVGLTTATLRFRERGTTDVRVRPANTAFGLSYSLPIVVAGLLAEPGGLLVVENPEAHLHPAAQSRMGRFLARVAAAGVQVVTETHSDHVLNGMRLAVAEGGFPDPDDLAVLFLDERSQVQRIPVSANGRLGEWPPGFFDQLDRDLADLARAGRTRGPRAGR